MALAHEKLDVYQASIAFIAWTQPLIESMPAKVSARDQLERASTSIALNIAEGNEKFSDKDRLRFWQIAQGSAVECSACLDVFVARKLLTNANVESGKAEIEKIVKMLMGLRKRFSSSVGEEPENYYVTVDEE